MRGANGKAKVEAESRKQKAAVAVRAVAVEHLKNKKIF
jgi:hypothetical protein